MFINIFNVTFQLLSRQAQNIKTEYAIILGNLKLGMMYLAKSDPF